VTLNPCSGAQQPAIDQPDPAPDAAARRRHRPSSTLKQKKESTPPNIDVVSRGARTPERTRDNDLNSTLPAPSYRVGRSLNIRRVHFL
jgi:hypothetical protein